MANRLIDKADKQREANAKRRKAEAANRRCPYCDAAPQQPCVSKSGHPLPAWRLWANDHSGYERQTNYHAPRWPA